VRVGGVDARLGERDLLGRADELRAIELAVDDVLGHLLGGDSHDVDPVIEDAGRVGRVRPQPLAIGTRNPFLDDDRLGPSRRGRVCGGAARRSRADDDDVHPFHTSPQPVEGIKFRRIRPAPSSGLPGRNYGSYTIGQKQ
jgi:hypothetical protein